MDFGRDARQLSSRKQEVNWAIGAFSLAVRTVSDKGSVKASACFIRISLSDHRAASENIPHPHLYSARMSLVVCKKRVQALFIRRRTFRVCAPLSSFEQ
ncbi:hypothetical protein F2P81_016177 [Scophthalmus maximus]|uniref:Uncharacterized protein n=1 Tax=Scophthalmus maximus TaxID=52904 RepID=A0A6A4SMU9_SCOMX|nr:hypothetical protein F2P81_016177 [Scophthalmus maximus]